MEVSESNCGLPLCNRRQVRLSSAPVEHSNLSGVKGTMNRARVILVSLFPALWLVAAADCLIDPVCACASNGLPAEILIPFRPADRKNRPGHRENCWAFLKASWASRSLPFALRNSPAENLQPSA